MQKEFFFYTKQMEMLSLFDPTMWHPAIAMKGYCTLTIRQEKVNKKKYINIRQSSSPSQWRPFSP